MQVGDIVFDKCRYSNMPVMFSGPVLVTKVHNDRQVDICYLNNPHTDMPQGLGHTYAEQFMPMDQVPAEWDDVLEYWVTRAICSDDPNLAMTFEAGEAVGQELYRLGVTQ
jgi:hypothetical protein